LRFPGGQESLDAGITNLGLKDQRIALQWMEENVAAFGGDLSKVTIWGESAGGVSVADQIIAYGGKGGRELFKGSILVSGFDHGVDPTTVKGTQPGFNALVAHANCTGTSDTLACLRSAPLSAIYPFEDGIASWGPMIDGDFIQGPPVYEVAS
jgi:carboxylesterase type B